MGENKTSLVGVWLAIALLFVSLIGGVYYFYTKDKQAGEAVVELSESFDCKQVTVQDKMMEHAEAVQEDFLYETYLKLPDVILESIYTKLGVKVYPLEVAKEYIRNREYYLSLQLSKEMEKVKLTGPDVSNIEKVELKTTLKKEKEPGEHINTIPVDSLH